jgi:uncharacterized protein
MSKPENRRFVVGTELRAGGSDDALVLEARILKYNALSELGVPDGGNSRECFRPGAFTDSIRRGDDVVGCLNHDQNFLLGRRSAGTLEIKDTPEALFAVFHLSPQVSFHRDIHALAKRGDLQSCSFAFSNAEDEWSEEQDDNGRRYSLRTVKRALLKDVSVVGTPAYGQGSTAVVARSLYRFANAGSCGVSPDQQALLAHYGRIIRDDAEYVRLREQAEKIAQDIRTDAFQQSGAVFIRVPDPGATRECDCHFEVKVAANTL